VHPRLALAGLAAVAAHLVDAAVDAITLAPMAVLSVGALAYCLLAVVTPRSGLIYLQRSGAHMTQQELGQKLGVAPRTIARWEAGVTHPTAAHRAGLAELLGGQPDWYDTRPAPVTFTTVSHDEVRHVIDVLRAVRTDVTANDPNPPPGRSWLEDIFVAAYERCVADPSLFTVEPLRLAITLATDAGEWRIANNGHDPYAEQRARVVDVCERLVAEIERGTR
jgi:DNA-binding XRE family transcriptional regulator